MRGKKWFKNQSIRKKILIIYIPLIIIPLFSMSYISNYIFSKATINETVKNVTDNSTIIVNRIDTMIENTENCANITALALIKALETDLQYKKDHASYIEMRKKIENELSTIKITFPDVDASAFIDNEGNLFCVNDNMKTNKDKADQSGLYEKIAACNTENQWISMQKRDYLVTDAATPVLTLVKKIINTKNGNTLGILILNIKESTISDIYKNMGPENIANDFIVDGQNKIVSSQNGSGLFQIFQNLEGQNSVLQDRDGSKIVTFDGQKVLLTSTSLKNLDWRLVSLISIRDLLTDVNTNKIVVFLIGGICLFLALLAATGLSNIIVKPLISLSHKMDEISDENLDIICDVDSSDEIGKLAGGFNVMVARIKELLHKSVLEQKKLRKYELALIQAQVKPHFLYNSLELIYTLCGMAGAQEAQNAVKSLANFYRIALSKGKEVVSLEDEIKIVSNYLNIQRYRYCDVFDYTISIPDELNNSKILKLTLQPIVENAIYHGLKTKGSFGQLQVEGYVNGENVEIVVRDDGVGMPKEKIQEIFDYDHRENNKISFGLRSVDERLKLFFGDDYGLRIDSELGKGTVTTVVIPLRWEEG